MSTTAPHGHRKSRMQTHIDLRRARLDREFRANEGADSHDVPESDHLDILKAFEPHVSMFLLLAIVAFVVAVIASVASVVTR